MSCSFTNQTIAQIDLLDNWKKTDFLKRAATRKAYDCTQVYNLPKELDEKVARLHLPALGAKLTQMTKEQADYIGVPINGPYKDDTYRY